MKGRNWARVVALAVSLVAVPAVAAAAPQAGPPGAPGPLRGGARRPPPGGRVEAPGGVTVAQAEQLFDRYVLAQARTALQLGPNQVTPFERRLQQLQMTRRRGQRQRQQLIAELGALSRGGGPGADTAVAEKLRQLDALNAMVEQDVRDAYARVEEVLTVRQRARFRVFEQRMERQKLELIARAREAAREGGAAEPPPDR